MTMTYNSTWAATNDAKAQSTFRTLRLAVKFVERSPAFAASPEAMAIVKKYYTLPKADARAIDDKNHQVYPWSKAIADGPAQEAEARITPEQIKILQGAYLLVDAGIRRFEEDAAMQKAMMSDINPDTNPIDCASNYKALLWDMGELMNRKNIELPSRGAATGR